MKLLLVSAVLACFLSVGLAIQCYNCVSYTDGDSCADPIKTSSVQTCSVRSAKTFEGIVMAGNTSPVVNAALDNINSPKTRAISYACIKTVLEIDNSKAYIRTCSYEGACDALAKNATVAPYIKHCSECSGDLCNSSSGLFYSVVLITICSIMGVIFK